MHTKWQIREEKYKEYILTKDLELHIIEIPKIREREGEEKVKKWILFMEEPEGEETKKMAEKEPEIKEAIETLEGISRDKAKARIAELRQKYIMDRASELETAEDKGIRKGREEGRQEAYEEKKVMAKKLKAIGVTTEEIKEITGLNGEEIEGLGDISAEEGRMRIAELRQKYIMDRASELETAEDKGIRKGRKEEKIDMARKLKSKNMPIKDIIEITGLSKEEIEGI